MTEERPIPSDPEVEAILGPERAIPRATDVDRAALWGRLAVQIPALELPPSASSSSSSLAIAKAAVVKVGLAAFVGGATAGVAFDRLVLREAPPPVTAAVSIPAPEPVPAVVLASPLAPTAQAPSPPSSPSFASPAAEVRVAPARAHVAAPAESPSGAADPTPAAAPPTPSPPSTLAEERELIDVAAAALGAGQLEAVHSALTRHHRRFPTGALSEEREGLWVLLAIASDGWGPAVEAQYTTFARAFPQSPLLLRLQAARARALKKVPTDSPTSPQ
ncbi:MAG: hypothetical protein IPG45_28550 [Deltaproteobacteria bacterium]|nr:hypothetical protein [Deltaproteobacteria bacterium]